jgi:hypothetical protein
MLPGSGTAAPVVIIEKGVKAAVFAPVTLWPPNVPPASRFQQFVKVNVLSVPPGPVGAVGGYGGSGKLGLFVDVKPKAVVPAWVPGVNARVPT